MPALVCRPRTKAYHYHFGQGRNLRVAALSFCGVFEVEGRLCGADLPAWR